MQRREALKNVALLLGGAISATTMGVLFESFTAPAAVGAGPLFTLADEKLLAEFGEIIVPATKDSGGAKLAGVGKFIPMMIKDCYPEKEQVSFAKGLLEFRQFAKSNGGKDFMLMGKAERVKLIGQLREMVIRERTNKTDGQSSLTTFFILSRDLSLLGYYASEIGCTQARAYVAVPGRYDGSAKMKPGQKSWAT